MPTPLVGGEAILRLGARYPCAQRLNRGVRIRPRGHPEDVAKLEEYKRKRDPEQTPEPFGGRKKRQRHPIFVVQRHDARRLHYDFRLERDGALASWAVPKGIPLEPGERHLAVHVEDHPLEYASFEGEIPTGNYGAGTVDIWDEGTYELVEEKPDGGLTVRLEGKRLRGLWTLVPARLSGDAKNWLIIRKRDESAPTEVPLAGTRYAPMLATLSTDLPSGSGWLFEVKWDGYRAIATLAGGEATLTSRRANDLTERFARVAKELPRAVKTPSCVLDGEVCALDDEGRSSFSAMQRGTGTLVYYVFDVLEIEGKPVIDLPFTERRSRLEQLLDRRNPAVRLSETFEDGRALLEAAREQHLEGVIAKRADSRYQPGRRTRDWLKVKPGGRQEFLIAGYTKGKGRRERTFGSLVLAVRRGDELVYVGNCGTGFDEQEMERLLREMRPLERKTPPFGVVPKMPRVRTSDVVWLTPKLVCEVGFVEWTHDGHLRAPVYKGLRDDKEPDEVRRELPVETEVKRGGRLLRLTNLDKVFWADEGITKGDLLSYYREVASHDEALPRGRGRRLLLPEGRAEAHAALDSHGSGPGDDAGGTSPNAHDPGAARERRARASLDGEHGLHRYEHVVLARRQAGPPGLRPLRPRPVSGRRLPGDRAGRPARQGGARPDRSRGLPEDERLRRRPRPRADRAPLLVCRYARVRRDRGRRAGPSAPWPRDDRMVEVEAARCPHRREPERRR
ncbi:MAG: hypothetical protein E6G67_08255 [Actinobacteria bacterium]|nr:MAG: hypothetical protein E6G67_08255 [Actinomycetota bacterium]